MNKSREHSTREELIAQLSDQLQINEKLTGEVAFLKEQLELLRRQIFGSRSESYAAQQIPEQLQLPLDTEAEEQPVEQDKEQITYQRKKKKPARRQSLPEHLPRREFIIEPQEDTTGMTYIGDEVTEVLAKQPSRLFVIRIIRRKYARQQGEGVVIGALPSRAIEKGLAHESLLADILVSKYVDHLPLYRQARILAREKVDIPSSTMVDWVSASCRLLEPLYEALKKEVFLNEYIQADESPIRVLDKTKKKKTHRGYQWVYHAVDPGLVLFDYQKGRGRDGPRELLKNFSGYLQTDGYSVYDEFEKNKDITLVGCMAHARRYFDQALDNDPVRAGYFLEQVQQLYLVEKALRENQADWEKRLELRQELAVPILRKLKSWLEENRKKVLPKSPIGKAIHYSLQRWDRLCRYTTHGGLEIDNNKVENQIRPLALGRKNYLFAGSHQGARNAAIIYSLLGSCRLNGLDPFQYLYAILTKIPDYPISKIDDLLPCHVRLEKKN
jgi:transposase